MEFALIHANGKLLFAKSATIALSLSQIGCTLDCGSPLRINSKTFRKRVTLTEADFQPKVPTAREKILSKYSAWCNETGFPQFIHDGWCYSCGFDLVDYERNCLKSVSGCPHCHTSFCE